ncbi:MAG: hypothetical protein IJR54_00800 [Oscillibacter sp.]|nr:hypothetical protein [Oscillibacter sp.]
MEHNPMRYIRFYLDPWVIMSERLTNEESGRLFKAALVYADTKGEVEPDFSDNENLAGIWVFARSAVDRDMACCQMKRELREYAAYIRRAKRRGLPFEDWRAAGCPKEG